MLKDKIILILCYLWLQKGRKTNFFFHPSLLLLFLDPGSWIRDQGSEIRDPGGTKSGSGINIQDP
jgi:hypothetical protein